MYLGSSCREEGQQAACSAHQRAQHERLHIRPSTEVFHQAVQTVHGWHSSSPNPGLTPFHSSTDPTQSRPVHFAWDSPWDVRANCAQLGHLQLPMMRGRLPQYHCLDSPNGAAAHICKACTAAHPATRRCPTTCRANLLPPHLELAGGVVCLLPRHIHRLLRQVIAPAERRRAMLSAQRIERIQHGGRVTLLGASTAAAARVN